MTTLLQSNEDILAIPVGHEWRSQPYEVTLDWNLQFGELVGDLNEVHVHPESSKRFQSHLGDRLVRQGSGTFSQAVSQIHQVFMFDEPVEIILTHDSTSYLRPARNGDFITYLYTLKSSERKYDWIRVAWYINATNQDGKVVLTSDIETRYYKAILR